MGTTIKKSIEIMKMSNNRIEIKTLLIFINNLVPNLKGNLLMPYLNINLLRNRFRK